MGESRAPLGTVHLGVDVGTSNTAAVLRGRDNEVRPVLFDGALLLPSAVFVDRDTTLVGLDAWHAGTANPALLEPNPKRRIDDRFVLLGEEEVPVEALFTAILRRVRQAAEQIAGRLDAVTLTYPATWGARRLGTLTTAAQLAGLPSTTTVYEPVSAAAHFVGLPDVDLAEEQLALVYDLGAGTFDATLIRRTGDGFHVVASQGLPDAGGIDIDAAIIASISAHLRPDDEAWRFLHQPRTPADLRNRRLLTDGVRTAKEVLSRTSATSIYVPVLDAEVPLGREQFDALARPLLDRTVGASRAVLRDAHVAEDELSAIFLVGGSTRIPLVGTLLHRALGRPPVVLDQPELAVVLGSIAGPPLPAHRPASPATRYGAGQTPPVDQPPPVIQRLPVDRAGSARPRRTLSALMGGRWRWTAAGLGLLLVVAVGLAYKFASDSGRGPTNPANASTSNPPTPTGTPTSASPSAPSIDAVAVVPASFVGRWTGRASQPGGVVRAWEIDVTFTAGSDIGTFRSSLGCRGTLTIMAPRPTAREMHLRQRTTSNPKSNCVAAADWTLIVAGSDRIAMYWQQFGEPTNEATATLTRR